MTMSVMTSAAQVAAFRQLDEAGADVLYAPQLRAAESIGGALARADWSAFMKATVQIRDEGSFAGFTENARTGPLNAFFQDDLKARS